MARRNKFQDSTIRIGMFVLLIVLIFYMILSFGGVESFSTVSLTGETLVRGGDAQEYHIRLVTVNPEQFSSPTHYREQYGRWRIENATGGDLSPGKETQIFQGVYDQYVTINIPFDQKKIIFVAEIVEYQYSAPSPDGKFIRDDGQVRISESIAIDIAQCADHNECNVGKTCLGQFPYCNEDNLCEVRGECHECISNTDCSLLEEAVEGATYECINFECKEYVEPTAFEEFKESFAQPINEPGPVEVGEAPQPKQSSPILSAMVFIMIALVSYMFLKRSGKL